MGQNLYQDAIAEARQLREMAEHTGLKIIASGGVSSMKDIEQLKNLEPYGVDQVISGKAIYERKIDHKKIFKCLQSV